MLRFLLFFLILPFLSKAQTDTTAYYGQIRMLELEYGFHQPIGDLNARFDFFSSVGGGISVLTKNDIQFQLGANLFFGNRVDQDVLSELRTESGLIIGSDGRDAAVFLRMRGAKYKFMVGKIFRTNELNRNGLKVMLGLGHQSNWTRIQDDSQSLTQASGDYIYGYDRLASGFSLEQFVGYQALAKNSNLNFYAGLEASQSFNSFRRKFNFGEPDLFGKKSLDIILGVRIGVMLTFYNFEAPEEIYY